MLTNGFKFSCLDCTWRCNANLVLKFLSHRSHSCGLIFSPFFASSIFCSSLVSYGSNVSPASAVCNNCCSIIFSFVGLPLLGCTVYSCLYKKYVYKKMNKTPHLFLTVIFFNLPLLQLPLPLFCSRLPKHSLYLHLLSSRFEHVRWSTSVNHFAMDWFYCFVTNNNRIKSKLTKL